MQYFICGVFLLVTGCVTNYRPGADMVSMTFKPKKMGIVRLDGKWKESKAAADAIMARFCAPQHPEITQVDNTRVVLGATSTSEKIFGQLYTDTELQTSIRPIFHFDCVEGKADSSKDDELDIN